VALTPVAVVPSPKSHAYDATEPGAASLDPEASTVQVAAGQSTVNDATGAAFGAESASGARTTVHIVALRDDALAVAVTPAEVPTAAGALRSEATAVTRPVPSPTDSARSV
jgi:hypothetical protein